MSRGHHMTLKGLVARATDRDPPPRLSLLVFDRGDQALVAQQNVADGLPRHGFAKDAKDNVAKLAGAEVG